MEILVPIAFFGMITTIAVGRPLAKAFAARLDPVSPKSRGSARSVSDPATDRRLAALEERLALLSAEVERGREEQRFLTELLSDRASLGPGARR